MQVYFRSKNGEWVPPPTSTAEGVALGQLTSSQGPVRLNALDEAVAVALDADSDLILSMPRGNSEESSGPPR